MVEVGDLLHAHIVDEVATTATFGTTRSYDIVAYRGVLADHGLASREGAYPVERVRGEAIVVVENVGVQPHR
jgi:hypothetical protein